MLRLFLFLIGFGLSVLGSMYIIMYLNYLAIGYSFLDYIKIVFTHFECLLNLIGLTIMVLVLWKGEKNDIYL